MKLRTIKRFFDFLKQIIRSTFFRYAVAGGTSSLIDVILFNILIYFSNTYYVTAVVISNTISFLVRFLLQKYYTFKAHSIENIHRQFLVYGLWFILSVSLTALLVFIFVDMLKINQSLSQIIAIFAVASVSFFIYKYVIFPEKRKDAKKILIITQKVDVNDPVLGFFHRWIEEFSEHFESVAVICLEKGEYALPENVKVFSLGKEERQSRIQYLIHFYWYILYYRNSYDAVFVHMNQQYVLLGGIIWKMLGRRIYMWRNHLAGNITTAFSVFLCDKVFCTSKFSYTARYKKFVIMPVGIDMDLFKKHNNVAKIPRSILFLGRMAPIKKPDLLISALSEMKNKGIDFKVSFYGDSLPKDTEYFNFLKKEVKKYGLLDKVSFHSGVANYKTVDIYNTHNVSINLSPSGLYDKTIFEAMACEILILASSKDLHEFINEDYIFDEDNVSSIIQKMEKLLNIGGEDIKRRGEELRRFVIENHSLKKLGEKIFLN